MWPLGLLLLSPVKRDLILHLNMLKYPFTDYTLVCQVVFENQGLLAFLRDVSVFSLHSKYLPLGNGMVSQLNKSKYLLPKFAFC